MQASDSPGAYLHAAIQLTPERMRELHHVCARLLTRAVLTLSAVPDRELTFQRVPGCSLPPSAPELVEIDHAELLRISMGQSSRRSARFRPNPQDLSRYLEVLSWLSHLCRQPGGQRDVTIIIARAHGVPYWKLTDRFGRSENTLKRWHNGAVSVLTHRFWRDIDRLS